jgi:integrase
VPGNPFSGLPIPTASQARDRVLTDEELGRVWNAAVSMGEPWGPLFRVLLLSLARREEVAAMRWSELSVDLSVWTIPGSRMKRGQPHVVALPAAARDALETVTRVKGQDLVFSTTARRRSRASRKARRHWTRPQGYSIGASMTFAEQVSQPWPDWESTPLLPTCFSPISRRNCRASLVSTNAMISAPNAGALWKPGRHM